MIPAGDPATIIDERPIEVLYTLEDKTQVKVKEVRTGHRVVNPEDYRLMTEGLQ